MFPNPANYFLPTPEAIEADIEELDRYGLATLIFELSEVLAQERIPSSSKPVTEAF